MNKYRWVEMGERIQSGDLWCPNKKLTEIVNNTDSNISIHYIGKSMDGAWKESWARLTPEEWIPFTTRKPTHIDSTLVDNGCGGKVGYVMIGNHGDIDLAPWDRAAHDDSYTHWRRLPELPPTERVVVDGHVVEPQKDGSVKVGCQTISSEDFEKIVKQRKEEMK